MKASHTHFERSSYSDIVWIRREVKTSIPAERIPGDGFPVVVVFVVFVSIGFGRLDACVIVSIGRRRKYYYYISW